MSISKVNVSNVDHQIVGSPRYATCSTAAATAAKVATIADGSSTFVLEKGVRICVSFTYANTASAATLNVANTGAKAICWNGSALVSSQYWQAGAVVDFVYDGNGWSIVGVAKDRPVFYVTITGTVVSPTADKTPAEIYQAYENGYAVYANVTLTGSSSSTNLKGLLPLTYAIAGIDGQYTITFSSTSGKEIKEVRYSPAIRKWEVPYSGVIATTDDLPSTPSDIGAQPKITAKGLLKGNGNGGVSAAVKGTDYFTPADVNEIAAEAAKKVDISDKVSKSGDTMTGKLTVPQVETGDGNSNYFQCRKFRGEGDANTYYHAIDFGYANHDKVDFHEYGGIWNFFKNTSGKANEGVLCGSITSNGWEGRAKLKSGSTMVTSQLTENSDAIATTAFVHGLVDGLKPKRVSVTLPASGWNANAKTQTVSVAEVTATANGSLRIAQSATDVQFAAWGAAQARVTAQAAGKLTVKAAGTVPTIDIPVEVLIV